MYEDIKFWIAHEIVKLGFALIFVLVVIVIAMVAAWFNTRKKD